MILINNRITRFLETTLRETKASRGVNYRRGRSVLAPGSSNSALTSVPPSLSLSSSPIPSLPPLNPTLHRDKQKGRIHGRRVPRILTMCVPSACSTHK